MTNELYPSKGAEIERRQNIDRFPARTLGPDCLTCADAIAEAIRQLERQIRFHTLIGSDASHLENAVCTLWAIYRQHGADDPSSPYYEDAKPWGFLTDLMDTIIMG